MIAQNERLYKQNRAFATIDARKKADPKGTGLLLIDPRKRTSCAEKSQSKRLVFPGTAPLIC